MYSLQGAHGHLDGMGQRRPIQNVVQTYLQPILSFAGFQLVNKL